MATSSKSLCVVFLLGFFLTAAISSPTAFAGRYHHPSALNPHLLGNYLAESPNNAYDMPYRLMQQWKRKIGEWHMRRVPPSMKKLPLRVLISSRLTSLHRLNISILFLQIPLVLPQSPSCARAVPPSVSPSASSVTVATIAPAVTTRTRPSALPVSIT